MPRWRRSGGRRIEAPSHCMAENWDIGMWSVDHPMTPSFVRQASVAFSVASLQLPQPRGRRTL